MLIAHETRRDLRRAAADVSAGVDAVVQCGTNLGFAAMAAQAELWLEMPVIAINTATYWHALRSEGIADKRRRNESIDFGVPWLASTASLSVSIQTSPVKATSASPAGRVGRARRCAGRRGRRPPRNGPDPP